jgi:SulP family sulfate permease
VLDSTAATIIEGFARRVRQQGAAVVISGAAAPIRRVLLAHGVRPPIVRFRTSIGDAVALAHRRSDDDAAEDLLTAVS